MTAVILGAEGHFPASVRSALDDLEDRGGQVPETIVFVVADPAQSEEGWLETLSAARAQYEQVLLFAIGAPERLACAFELDVDDALVPDISFAEAKARLQKAMWAWTRRALSVRASLRPAAWLSFDGVHQAVSDGYCELFDLPERQIVGRKLAALMPGTDVRLPSRDDANATIFVVAQTNEVDDQRMLFVCVPVERGVLAVVHHDTVDPVNGVDRLRVATQARRLMTLGAVSMGLAHDFNNLLTVILGNTAFLKDELNGTASQQRLLRDLEHSATRAGDLTEQILRYAASAEESAQPVDLNMLVRDVGPFLRALVAPLADLRLELDNRLLEIEAEVSGMTQLLVNVVQNAAEATTDPGASVVIRTGSANVSDELLSRLEPQYTLSEPAAVYLEVEDRGVGMTPATVAQIFEPFFSTRGHGRGLGLSVVRDVARSHGGGIEVDSVVGRGTRVRVWLPPTAEVSVPAEVAVSAERLASRGLVLVADDEPEVRGLLHRILVTSGFEVLEAEDGGAALELVEAHPNARMLMLDLTMPRLDGVEVVRRLVAKGRSLPVVMMSGYSLTQAKSRLATLEVAGFLKKPFLPGAVTAKVMRILGDTFEDSGFRLANDA